MEDKTSRIEPRAELRNTGIKCDYDHIEGLKEQADKHERANRKIKTRFKRVIRDQVEAKILAEREAKRKEKEKEAEDES